MAHAAIDAGADLILQHHAHMLRGIEVYSDKVIFYGLGNFAEEVYFMTEEWVQSTKGQEDIKYLNPDWNPPYLDYPSYPFPPDSRKTIIAKCTINNKEINRLSFLPAYINNKAEPEILTPENGRFGEVVRCMEEITEDQGLATRYTVDGDEVIVHK
jgi:poly-gamma-glutamate synthesis protein (capsule biosynthesis protein)